MRLTLAACVLVVLWAAPARGQDAVPLKVDGAGVKTVTLVTSFPVTVSAPPGAGLVFWAYPPGVQAADMGDKLIITGAPKGDLAVTVKVISAEVDWTAKKVTYVTRVGRVSLVVGDSVPPDPGPKPEPPKPVSGLKVLIVEEAADRTKLPQAQQLLILGKPMRDFLDSKCTQDKTASGKGWYIVDKDQDLSALPKFYQDAKARTKGLPMPRIVIGSDAGVIYEGPLPADFPAAQALINQYAARQLRKAG